MKKSEMQTDVNYLLCPDKSCNLFFDASRRIPCESECPRQQELIKMIICHGCEEIVELPGDHYMFLRVDHNGPNGYIAANFHRMSGKYQLMRERPE